MTLYKIKLNIEGGKTLEMNLDKEEFYKMSETLDSAFPDKQWNVEKIPALRT